MREIIKREMIVYFLFIQLGWIEIVQTAVPYSNQGPVFKKDLETISFERSVRSFFKWREEMDEKFKHDPYGMMKVFGTYIDQIKDWEGDRAVFWLLLKNIRMVLVTQMEKIPQNYQPCNQQLIKGFIEGIYKLDRIANQCDSLLAAALSNDGEKEFYTEVRRRFIFSKGTVNCILIL